jgi:hypothetical protein
LGAKIARERPGQDLLTVSEKVPTMRALLLPRWAAREAYRDPAMKWFRV